MANEQHDTHRTRGGDGQGPDRHGPFNTPRRVRLGLAAIALVALGAVAATAFQVSAHGSRGWGHRASALGVEEVRERTVERAEWVLDAVEASPEQRARVNAILGETIERVHPLVERHRTSRRAFVAELTRPEPDAAALESLRVAEMALLDEATREAVEALARVSAILTPEQRIELVERAGRFGHH